MDNKLNPEMIERHRGFWERSEVSKPLIDFFVGTLFPLEEFRGGLNDGLLSPDMVIPEAFEFVLSGKQFLHSQARRVN